MVEYRLYFLDGENHVVARVEFEAPSDDLAIRVATVVAEESSDLHSGYMLWHAARQVFTTEGYGPHAFAHPLTVEPVSREGQRLVTALEQILLDSPWQIAKSPRLLAATARLKEEHELAG